MDINKIRDTLPHRYPFLLVDRVLELEPGKKVVGIKNVTINEEFFLGHYPGHPIMPGVLIVEAMAQVGGLLMLESVDKEKDMLPFFAGIDKAKFRQPVIPGDRLRIEAEVIRLRNKTGKLSAKSFVEQDLAAEAELMFALQYRERS
ncbi:MAG: 3-hydroxyacyl-ACP dehydratase FabZ [Halanaerobiaceae bacterium]